MQPENPQQIPQPVGQPQPLNPAVATAFQSVASHPNQLAQNPGLPIQLPRQKKSIGSILTIVTLSFLLLSALGFGVWAFGSMQEYKNNSDKKSQTAVDKALADQKVSLDATFAEQEKQPYDTYNSSASSGNIVLKYPKTWSAYISESDTSDTPVDAYFHPKFVPNTLDNTVAIALRLQVVNTSFSDLIKQYDSSQTAVTQEPFVFPLLPDLKQKGTKITGQIISGSEKIQGTMILYPLRDKTIKLWTESSSAFGNDFTTSILPNFSFTP